MAFPRLSPGDSERRFERFIRAIRKVNNLSDARRFRSEVASQLKKDSRKEGQDHVYLRRLDMGKRLLDQRVQHLAAGGDRRAAPPLASPALNAGTSKLENASLVELLRDTSGLSYFMEYMDRQKLMPLVQFWLVVDGFRNPLEDDGPEDEQLPSTLPPFLHSSFPLSAIVGSPLLPSSSLALVLCVKCEGKLGSCGTCGTVGLEGPIS